MTDQNFENIEWLVETLKKYIERVGFNYSENNPDPDNTNFQITIRNNAFKIVIGQIKQQKYKFDIVIRTELAQKHINAYNLATDNQKQNLKDVLSFWMLPRDHDFLVDFIPIDLRIKPFYLIVFSIYEGELSLGSLVKGIDTVLKSNRIATRLIQLNLDNLIQSQQTKQQKKEE